MRRVAFPLMAFALLTVTAPRVLSAAEVAAPVADETVTAAVFESAGLCILSVDGTTVPVIRSTDSAPVAHPCIEAWEGAGAVCEVLGPGDECDAAEDAATKVCRATT